MSSKRFNPLSREDLEATIRRLSDCADETGTRVVIAGGNAMAFYGSPRMTGDVDVLASSEVDAEAALSCGEVLGRITFGGLKGKIGAVDVDVLVRDDELEDLYEEAIDFAMPLPGTSIYIVTPEYLAAMKLGARREKDFSDLEYLIQADALGLAGRPLDVDRAREIVHDHLGTFGSLTFDDFVEEARLYADLPERKNPRRRPRRRK